MRNPPNVETVLFDLDGTLIDSNGAHAHAWTQSLLEHSVEADIDQVRRLIGMGADKLLPAVAHVPEDSDLGRSIARRKKALFDALLPGLESTAGARPLLEYLAAQRVDLVIATSADRRELSALLRQAGLGELFREWTSKDDAAESKPDPDIVRAALAKSQARQEVSLLIGDTPYDIEAASRAGIGAIALRCGGYWPDSSLRGALEIFDDPAALLAYWQERGVVSQ